MTTLQPLIAPERIMKLLDVEPRYFWEVIAVDPAFPKPVLAESRKINPLRVGEYECLAYFGGGQWKMMLHWDGVGFLTAFPMRVFYWRGLTKSEHGRNLNEQ